jgi:V8-like Glu-specific endopeptidase
LRFVGGIPDIMQYDSTLVTATIMPGSSGSGVYNENKELAGVVFAGRANFHMVGQFHLSL